MHSLLGQSNKRMLRCYNIVVNALLAKSSKGDSLFKILLS